jgi:hypothetical protein
VIPCTRFTRNNPGCRCDRCIEWRRLMKKDEKKSASIQKVRRSEARKRAAPWEGKP